MKDSKLNATWSPYIKYLQGKNSKKEEQTSEKPSQPLGRVRKISIFGRKSSAQSSETLHKPTGNGTPEHIRHRNQRKIRSEIFHSNDSLHDGQSYSTADQHTDDEHGKEATVGTASPTGISGPGAKFDPESLMFLFFPVVYSTSWYWVTLSRVAGGYKGGISFKLIERFSKHFY